MKKTILLSCVLLSSILACKKAPERLSDEAYSKLSEDDRRKTEHALDGIQTIDSDLELTLLHQTKGQLLSPEPDYS